MHATDLESRAVVNLTVGTNSEVSGANGEMLGSFLITRKIPRDINKIELKGEEPLGKRFYWNDIPLLTTVWEEFPARQEFTEGRVISLHILDSIYRAMPFCGKDALKPALCGIHVYNKASVKGGRYNQIIVEATGGHYLYKDTLEIKTRKKFEFILPHRSLIILKKLMVIGDIEKIMFYKKSHFMTFQAGDHYLEVRLIDERYPNVDSVIPDLNNMTARVMDVKIAFETFDYIRDVAPINQAAHTIELLDKEVICRDVEKGLLMKLPIGFKVPIHIGYNMEYLHMILKAMKMAKLEEFNWYFETPVSASLFVPHDATWVYLIMPVRLESAYPGLK
jgi:DNA polymerase-3 subunit beta